MTGSFVEEAGMGAAIATHVGAVEARCSERTQAREDAEDAKPDKDACPM